MSPLVAPGSIPGASTNAINSIVESAAGPIEGLPTWGFCGDRLMDPVSRRSARADFSVRLVRRSFRRSGSSPARRSRRAAVAWRHGPSPLPCSGAVGSINPVGRAALKIVAVAARAVFRRRSSLRARARARARSSFTSTKRIGLPQFVHSTGSMSKTRSHSVAYARRESLLNRSSSAAACDGVRSSVSARDAARLEAWRGGWILGPVFGSATRNLAIPS